MAQVYQNIGHLILMILLLAGSAFFSGSETAFFSLSRRQIALLKRSEHKLQKLSAKLLSRPSQLLSCLLLGNMIVNVLFFALASVLSLRMSQEAGKTAAAVTAFVSFVMLVLFGEILPKSLAYTNAKSISLVASLPAFVCLQVARPVLFVFRLLIVEPALRLILGHPKRPKPIASTEFKLLIEQVRRRGLITADENRLLSEIIELGFLKVRHVVQPRVDMVACAVTDSAQAARKLMQEHHLTKLPVYSGRIDNIIGLVHLRQLLLRPTVTFANLVEPAHFVPEQKTVESLLEYFRKTQTDTAIVVDEYGGIAGLVRLEDIAEELLGPISITEGIEPIEKIGPFQFRLAGNLAIHDWADALGINPEETPVSTLGGLVTALLGRIPKSGDVAHLNNLKFTVERVRKRRIETVILTFEPIVAEGK